MLKRLFKESLVYGLSTYIQKFIGVFLLPFYTALLAPSDYGVLDILGTVSVISIYLVISGTDSALSYYYYRKEFLEQRPEMVSTTLMIRISFSLTALGIIYILSSNISMLVFGKPDYSLFVILSGFTLAFQSIYSFFTDLIRFELRPWFYTIVSASGVLVSISLNIYFILFLKQGVYGALMASVIAYGLLASVTIIYVFMRYGFHFSGKWASSILKYGSPLIVTAFAVWILNSTDRYFLVHYLDLSAVGIYSVGSKLASFLGLISGALQMAWGPFAMNIQYEPNAKKVYAKVFLIYFVINIIGVFLISMFSIDLLKVFTQPVYYSAKAVVPFLCMSVVFFSGYFIVSIGIAISKKAQHTIWITVIAAILNISMNFLLTPVIGAVGAALSIMSANFLIFILCLSVSQKLYHIDYAYKQVFGLLIPAALIVAGCYYFDARIAVRIILASVYVISAGIFLYYNFKNSEEIKKLIEKIKKGKLEKKDEPPPDVPIYEEIN